MRALAALLLTGALAGCAASAPPAAAPVAPAPVAAAPSEPALPSNWSGMQYLYGSGEGAGASLQTFRALTAHALAAAARRPAEGVVLADPKALTTPTFTPCGTKPPAVIFDADETLIHNLGYEYALAKRGLTSGGPLLKAYQSAERPQSRAMPGAIEALRALRAAGIKVIVNTGRDVETGEATRLTLAHAGLGDFVVGETLLLRGHADGGRGKDGRRARVASTHCVVAMAGDQLADFVDAFNDKGRTVLERRALAARFDRLWGAGWFILPNPVYGPQIEGGIDDVFPPDTQWNGE